MGAAESSHTGGSVSSRTKQYEQMNSDNPPRAKKKSGHAKLGGTAVCPVCRKAAYPMESCTAKDGSLIHRTCFICGVCKTKLSGCDHSVATDGTPLCAQHSVHEAPRSRIPADLIRAGSLVKRGHIRKNWLKRWFTFDLERMTLSYFASKTSAMAKGEIDLHGCHVQTVTFAKFQKSNLFVISTDGGIDYFLEAKSDNDVKKWIETVIYVRSGGQRASKADKRRSALHDLPAPPSAAATRATAPTWAATTPTSPAPAGNNGNFISSGSLQAGQGMRGNVKQVKEEFGEELEDAVEKMIPRCPTCGGVFTAKQVVIARGLFKFHDDCMRTGKPCHPPSTAPKMACKMAPDLMTLRFYVSQSKGYTFFFVPVDERPVEAEDGHMTLLYGPDPTSHAPNRRKCVPPPPKEENLRIVDPGGYDMVSVVQHRTTVTCTMFQMLYGNEHYLTLEFEYLREERLLCSKFALLVVRKPAEEGSPKLSPPVPSRRLDSAAVVPAGDRGTAAAAPGRLNTTAMAMFEEDDSAPANAASPGGGGRRTPHAASSCIGASTPAAPSSTPAAPSSTPAAPSSTPAAPSSNTEPCHGAGGDGGTLPVMPPRRPVAPVVAGATNGHDEPAPTGNPFGSGSEFDESESDCDSESSGDELPPPKPVRPNTARTVLPCAVHDGGGKPSNPVRHDDSPPPTVVSVADEDEPPPRSNNTTPFADDDTPPPKPSRPGLDGAAPPRAEQEKTTTAPKKRRPAPHNPRRPPPKL